MHLSLPWSTLCSLQIVRKSSIVRDCINNTMRSMLHLIIGVLAKRQMQINMEYKPVLSLVTSVHTTAFLTHLPHRAHGWSSKHCLIVGLLTGMRRADGRRSIYISWKAQAVIDKTMRVRQMCQCSEMQYLPTLDPGCCLTPIMYLKMRVWGFLMRKTL